MGLSKKLVIAGIALSSMISCKPNQYIQKMLDSNSSRPDVSALEKNSNEPFDYKDVVNNVVVANMIGDLSLDTLYSDFKGLNISYTKRKKTKIKNVYSYEDMYDFDLVGDRNISTGYIDDNSSIDILHSFNSKILVLTNNGDFTFKKNQEISRKNIDSSSDLETRMLTTLLEDNSGTSIVALSGDSLYIIRSNFDGYFELSKKKSYFLGKGIGGQVSNLSTGYLKNDKYKSLLIPSLEGIFTLDRNIDERGELINKEFIKSKYFYYPRAYDGVENRNSMSAIVIETKDDSQNRLDEIVYISNNNMVHIVSVGKGKSLFFQTLNELDPGIYGYKKEVNLNLSHYKNNNGNIKVYLSVPDGIYEYFFGPEGFESEEFLEEF